MLYYLYESNNLPWIEMRVSSALMKAETRKIHMRRLIRRSEETDKERNLIGLPEFLEKRSKRQMSKKSSLKKVVSATFYKYKLYKYK